MATLERQAADAFSDHGLRLGAGALAHVLEYLRPLPAHRHDAALDVLLSLLLDTPRSSSLVQADAALADAIRRAARTADAAADADLRACAVDDALRVIDAFETPRFTYDLVRKQFHRAPAPPRLHATAEAKASLYRERYALLLQRLQRSKLFHPPSLSSAARGERRVEITPLQALLGTVGETRFVLGALSQLEEGAYHLEDLSGKVRVDVAGAETSAGLFTENCVVIAEGQLRNDNVFEVRALGLPLTEPRETSAEVAPGIDFFGAGILRPAEVEKMQRAAAAYGGSDSFVLLADVFLDKPHVMQGLRTVLGGFAGLDVPPTLIALMGDFQSTPFGAQTADFGAIRDGFAALAEMLEEFPSLQATRVLVMPGPGDSLPSSLVAELTERCPNVQVRWYTQEIVLSREDAAARMRRACLRPPADAFLDTEGDEEARSGRPRGHPWPPAAADTRRRAQGGGGVAADEDGVKTFKHLAATLIQQAHLAPLPLPHAPVYWEWDHALWLYPAPHAVVLADRTVPQAQCAWSHTDTLLFNTGSFGSDGSFAVYRPAERRVEMSGVQLE